LRAHEMAAPESLPPEMLEEVRRVLARHFQDEAALLVASLRAAGRTEEAGAVEEEALRRDPSPELRVAIARLVAESGLVRTA